MKLVFSGERTLVRGSHPWKRIASDKVWVRYGRTTGAARGSEDVIRKFEKQREGAALAATFGWVDTLFNRLPSPPTIDLILADSAGHE